jgi:hypothetical protein
MSIFDQLLGQITGNIDVQNLAGKVGLTTEQTETAIAALGKAHPEPGDTVETAAANTGLSTDVLQQIVGHIGGEGSLAQFASMLNDGGGEGLLGKVSHLFGKS